MHKCPVENCSAMLPTHLLMCRTHWAQVPQPLQRAVYQGWNAQNRSLAAIPGYLKARKAAIEAVKQIEGGDR